MSKSKSRRLDASVNAGSMADIAFLLLIFFLVTTTIEVDKGILAKLPPWTPDEEIVEYNERNVLSVKINAQNQLLVERDLAKIEDLKNKTKEFILNPNQSPELSESPKKAVISLQNDRGTSYKTYLQVYNELKAAYNELREEAAQAKYQESFNELEKSDRDEIRKAIPMIISEAEPTEYGEG